MVMSHILLKGICLFYSWISSSLAHFSFGCLYHNQALSAMLSGLRFFASGETTPPMLSKPMWTSLPYLSCIDSTKAR